jgi:RNA polymerase sigma factor (sigma-70 family)
LFGFVAGACYFVNMTDDAQLLRRYVEGKSEAAFAELVRCHLGLVYGVALRQTGGDTALAEDVAQQVFTDLARKARSLSDRAVLGGWLYRSTQFAASNVVRVERRRRAREEEAQRMHEQNQDPATTAEWEKLRPVLDAAVGELGERDRDAVVLRFFEGRAFAEIGAALRLSEDAARMRVERALEKLRVLLARRGVTSTGAALGLALAGQPGLAAPVGLAAAVTSTALAGAGAGVASAVAVFFAMNKIKVGVVGILVLAGMSIAVVDLKATRAVRAELRPGGVSGRDEEREVMRLQRENRQLSAQVAQVAAKNPAVEELTRVRNRISALKARPEGVVEEEIRTPRNVGRATPAAAMETFCWALDQDDLELGASFISFRDDTPENRAAFMASVSEAVRARYGTPERLLAAGLFGLGAKLNKPTAVQVYSVVPDDEPNAVKVRIWWRSPDGKEAGGGETYTKGPAGWGGKPVSLRDEGIIALVRSAFNPATGDFIPFPDRKK